MVGNKKWKGEKCVKREGNFVQNLIVIHVLLFLIFTKFFINVDPLANFNKHHLVLVNICLNYKVARTLKVGQNIFGKNIIWVPTFLGYIQFRPHILVTINLVHVIFNFESIWSLLPTLSSLTENVYMANSVHNWHT